MNIEIIEFAIPTCNRKNLFVTNIPTQDELLVYDLLYRTFSKYGLLYEVQVFPATGCNAGRQVNESPGYYAFVKFYSYRSALRAKEEQNNRLSIGSSTCKVAFAKRRKGDNQVTTLFLAKCQELASYYLGFNGWSSNIQILEEDKECVQPGGDLKKIKYFCSVRLDLTNQNLSCDGVGAWEETCSKTDVASQGGVLAKVQKTAHRRAMEHAFSKLVIISLSNGKVSVEVNTTRTDQILRDNMVDEAQLLKVNELEEAPVAEEDREEADIDDINMQVLQELEDPD
ncbi:RAD52 motif-containing protein 1-like [Haliotis rufescens]|uniref:RAD52 motif-containing protein 1-like n=1 Tax=Haliotis rufescens TaxID=6454 RepID=UPI00201F8267|nr:RAD52 motif-containing protein 1-like [Haliotis rufescens]